MSMLTSILKKKFQTKLRFVCNSAIKSPFSIVSLERPTKSQCNVATWPTRVAMHDNVGRGA